MVITVANWSEADEALKSFADGRSIIYGTGYDYPADLAVMTKNYTHGEGMGYTVWSTEAGRCASIVASISIAR